MINTVSNFICGGTIESVYVPFHCGKCKSNLHGLFQMTDLKNAKLPPADLPCPKCDGSAKFDDLPQDYFRFVTR